ncbi:Uncharacterized protein PPKH_3839 [Pseudomonas putida]|nr:Uncharacterized protein PPKH_3839 [Pseudomonas putida]
MDLRKIGRRDGRSWKLPDVITKAVAVGRYGRLPLGQDVAAALFAPIAAKPAPLG